MIPILVVLLAVVAFLLVRWTTRNSPSPRPQNEENENDITIRPT